MVSPDHQCLFAGSPLDRASERRISAEWVTATLADPKSIILPLWRGDPLMRDGAPAWLAVDAFPGAKNGAGVFLGLLDGSAYFTIDVSQATDASTAPFADIGQYTSLRDAAGVLSPADLAIIGQARWMLEWHRRHRFCANCGAETAIADAGAKRICRSCDKDHFPRTDPVAIVLAVNGDDCLLGRSPNFPSTFFSALAGYIEAAETPEECAIRELKEEAGIEIYNVRYQFSQPWPFPSSLMMGFLALTDDRVLTLDKNEVEEARWVSRSEVRSILNGEMREDLRLPPRFTIARQLIDVWAR